MTNSERVGYLILMPSDPHEVVSSLPMIRCLHGQVEGAWVGVVADVRYKWIFESVEGCDQFIEISYPLHKMAYGLHDYMPDWLIDLRGSFASWRLKNRLKVLDLSIKRNRIKNLHSELFNLVSLFDVSDDGVGVGIINSEFNRSKLPESFKDGYITVFLDYLDFPSKPIENQMVELLSRIERYTVLAGSALMRPIAESIGKQIGCTIFVTCGDFSQAEMTAMLSDSSGVISFDSQWNTWADVLKIPEITITFGSENRWTQDIGHMVSTIRNWKLK